MPRASAQARPPAAGSRRRPLVALAVVAALAACRGGRTSSRAPTCADAAGQIARGMVKIRPDLATASIDPTADVVALCVDDAWEPEAIRCYAGTDEPRALRTCSDRLASDQRLHAREVQERLYRRASEVSDGSDGPTGIPACDELVALTAEFRRCDKIPAHIKEALAEGIDQLRPEWESLDDGSSDVAREHAELECMANTETLRQRMIASGC